MITETDTVVVANRPTQRVRRAQIDEIQRTIDTLTQALLDVGYDDWTLDKEKTNLRKYCANYCRLIDRESFWQLR